MRYASARNEAASLSMTPPHPQQSALNHHSLSNSTNKKKSTRHLTISLSEATLINGRYYQAPGKTENFGL